MHSIFRAVTIVALSLLLTACPRGIRPPTEPVGEVPPLPPPDLRGALLYDVSAADSDLAILVFRGGTLARLGHNHVMSSKSIEGRVWIHSADVQRSGFELSFPVNELIVDDPEARANAAGAFPEGELPPEIPQADREGTRKNMLREQVLDGEHFADVTLQAVRVSGTLAAPTLLTRITIKGVSRDIEVPAIVTIEDAKLTAQGEFAVLQTDFGITPFSIGMGALEVQNQLKIRFSIVAMAVGA